MLKVTNAERKFIVENLEDGEGIIKSDTLRDLTMPLDDWILENGFDDDYSLNDVVRKVQVMYDNIYYRNTYETD